MSPESKPTNRAPILIAVFVAVGLIMALGVLFASPSPQTAPSGTRAARVPSAGANAATGWTVPDFDIDLLDAPSGNITDYRGDIVFINFWATWCVPCQREMPTFSEFVAENPQNVTILAINHGEDPAEVRNFRRLFQLADVPIVMDPDFEISDGFGVVNLPVTYVLDGEGVVQAFHIGEITRDDMDTYIAEIRTSS